MAVELLAGRYKLGPKIGEGGMAVVYRAQDVHLGRDVAIKVLRAAISEDEPVAQRFRRAAEASSRLTHPNIAAVLDVGEAAGRPYIVAEFLPEPDLKEIIVRYAPLPDHKVAQVGIDCCRALEYAHRQGMVHHDIKPQNILFTSDGVAKVSDFGLAAATADPGLASGKVHGTPAYMAPEHAQGLPATAQSDLYSLGCVLYEAVTGRPPFEDDDPTTVMRRQVHDRPPSIRSLNPGVSPSLEFIINKAMAKDPARRYRTAREMLADLQKVAAGAELDRTGVLAADTTIPARVEPDEDQVPWYAEPPRSTTHEPVRSRQPSPQPTGMRSPATVALVVVAAVIFIIALAWLVKHAFYPGVAPKLVQVPSVKNIPEQQARDALAKSELTVGTVTYQYSDTFAEGVVIDQRPEMGQTVQAGTPVALVVNRGKQVASVPDLEGTSLEEARRRLQALGLAVGEVEEQFDERHAVGLIIKQHIRPGTKIDRGAGVDLTVSKGPAPKPVQPVQPVQPPPVQPGPVTPGPNPSDVSSVYPDVVVHDLTADKPREEEHTYEIRITVLGRNPQQDIRVLARDASGRRIDVLHEKLDPQTTRKVTVKLKGNANIDVYHDQRLFFQKPVPSEE